LPFQVKGVGFWFHPSTVPSKESITCWAAWKCCPREGAAYNDPLQGLGHVEPGTRKWRIERQDAVLKQPTNHVARQVSGQIVPDQDETESKKRFRTFVGPPLSPGEEQWVIVWQRNTYCGRLLV
jgi:hypothetical protein